MKIFRIIAFPPIITAFYIIVKYLSNEKDLIDFKLYFPNGLNFKDYMKLHDAYIPKGEDDKFLMDSLVFFGNLMYLSLAILFLLVLC